MREVCTKSVLLVEDEPALRKLFSIFLTNVGFDAILAVDGIDGIVKLRDSVPVVIVSDLLMPRMSGIEFISVVRRRFPPIPVVALSGAIPDEFPEEAKPDVWLNKTKLHADEFAVTVQNLARRVPERVDLPQVVLIPFRTRVDFTGYFRLTCPDCLRTFKATNPVGNESAEGSAVCAYCEARVLFLIEGLEHEATLRHSA
jgi:CheY-like chemotaxis protein